MKNESENPARVIEVSERALDIRYADTPPSSM